MESAILCTSVAILAQAVFARSAMSVARACAANVVIAVGIVVSNKTLLQFFDLPILATLFVNFVFVAVAFRLTRGPIAVKDWPFPRGYQVRLAPSWLAYIYSLASRAAFLRPSQDDSAFLDQSCIIFLSLAKSPSSCSFSHLSRRHQKFVEIAQTILLHTF